MSSVYLPARLANAILVVADIAGLPTAAESIEGDIRWVSDQDSIYAFDGLAWTNESGIVGPGVTTDDAVVRWDGTSGVAVQNSTVTLSDAGVMAGVSIDADTNTLTNIEDADIKAGAAIDAAKLHDGSVSNTEFGYINTLTSNAQTQLDAMVEKAGDTMTGLLTLSGDPSTSLQAATKQYVDGLIDGVQRKKSVLVSTTANITLSGEQTIDGELTSASRVLVRFQTDQTENGIYVSDAAGWSRAVDANSGAELNHAIVSIEAGTLYSDRAFEQTTDTPTIGADNIVWIQAYGAGTYVASETGLKLTGATFFIDLDGTTLSQSASGLQISSTFQTTVSNKLDNVVEDTTPQLGGSLDLNSNRIVDGANNVFHTIGGGNTFLGNSGNITLSGTNNTAVGNVALDVVTTGGSNTSVGSNALGATTTTSQNTAVGHAALFLNTGSQNIGMGYFAGADITSFDGNTAIGTNALRFMAGHNNTALGRDALKGTVSVSSGGNNLGIGQKAGDTLTTGSDNVFIGTEADTSDAAVNNSVAIGANSVVGTDNTIRFGDDNANMVEFAPNTTIRTPSSSNGDLTLNPDGTGVIKLDDGAANTIGEVWTATATDGAGEWAAAPVDTLNDAYVAGNTVTTSAGEGDFVITGTEKLHINKTGSVDHALTVTTDATHNDFAVQIEQKSSVSGGGLYVKNSNVAISGTGFWVDYAGTGKAARVLSTLATSTSPSLELKHSNVNSSVLRFSGATSGDIDIKLPLAAITSYDLTLPSALGAAGSVLTDAAGNGTLSWAVPTVYLADVVGDTTPQLGGALDVNGNSITSASNGDIVIDPNGTGKIKLDDGAANAVNDVWTATATDGSGEWVSPPTETTVALASDFISSDTGYPNIPAMSVAVTIGKRYMVILQSCVAVAAADNSLIIKVTDGVSGTVICRNSWSWADTKTNTLFLVTGTSGIFTATASTFEVELSLASTSSKICGNGTHNETFIQVIEI